MPLEAEWHDAKVDRLAWQGRSLVIELRMWIHDASTRRCRLHPVRLSLDDATVDGPLTDVYDVMGGVVVVDGARWEDMLAVPSTMRDVTICWNDGCAGKLAPVTLAAKAATLEIVGPATAEETMP